jgi:6-phosphogluconate dehydrogenase
MSLIGAGSREYKWGIDLGEMARIWKGGCIIRAGLLDTIRKAYARDGALPNLLVDDEFAAAIAASQNGWRRTVTLAQSAGVAIPAMSASLAYFDAYRSARVPANLVQAQRDYFGAHTYERVDKPELGFVHSDWKSKA